MTQSISELISPLRDHTQLQGICFEQGVYYQIALEILKNSEWVQHRINPRSISNLTPFAESYQKTLKAALIDTSAVPDLRTAHIRFMNGFIVAVQHVYPLTSGLLKAEHGDTIELFKEVVQENFSKVAIQRQDRQIYSTSLKLVLEFLRNHREKKVPKFFAPFQEKIEGQGAIDSLVEEILQTGQNAAFFRAVFREMFISISH